MIELQGDGVGLGASRNGAASNGAMTAVVGSGGAESGGRVSFVDFRFVPQLDEDDEEEEEEGDETMRGDEDLELDMYRDANAAAGLED